MYVNPISTLLLSGRSTPAILAISSPVLGAQCSVLSGSTQHWALSTEHLFLSLSLFVFGVCANDPHDALAPHDLALAADSLH
jgi:hypothetical protein